ncbi:MAG: accessory factor UbiK family protein [Porticoccaceae bacterium]|jgi:BMFP domain-containing protein YqiC|nr:accessory factor UbiK family protein [Porticoccaceae bacterium]MEA3299605.1 accessory factor UbiK family protein [Pseudomonadota bacterium]HLS97483.1 accessory factor UbiK family protein [Porticoccaceae bacterium]
MASDSPDDPLARFTRQFAELAGPGFASLSGEMRQQLRAAIQGAFARMDFVPREDFEAQQAVLQRSRQKLDQLERQLAALEASLAARQPPE